ncbi:hypothetical protein CCMSSC00406_0009676 [Pleurotus cornucopiae]|uniref:Uncharacterized protein n=1 Tax=Pleurotus cornucopiae TaxID=5321 RepID=A0ACB7J879_PLECO|nr:hypothetical protein CCMSSC00406_0009676 [Pleurotus cornucopiae]
MAEQCAIGPDGELLPASHISFIYDPDDPVPMPAKDTVDPEQRFICTRGPAHLSRKTQDAITDLQRDEYGNKERKFTKASPSTSNKPRVGKKKISSTSHPTAAQADSDASDEDFAPDVEQTTSSDSEESNVEPTNEEIAAMLPSKITPTITHKARSKKRRHDSKSSPPRTKRLRDVTKSGTLAAPEPLQRVANKAPLPTPKGKPRSMIYLFYEQVTCDSNGKSVPGDQYYRCYHGNPPKTLRITAAMKNSTNSLVGHIQHNFPMLHRLYEAIKARGTPPTPEELDIAANRAPMNAEAVTKFVTGLEKQSASIVAAFQLQLEKNKASLAPMFDQEMFERLLAEWMAACDQPFMEVDRPELQKLLQYTFYHGGGSKEIHIPNHTTMNTKIMKFGKQALDDIIVMFAELDSKVSLSLDAWTSPNQYAFLAIVAHFVTNDGCLDELLIDFTELIGEHTGANMADAVWSTMKRYGLIGRVIAIVMDNASNNNTLMEALEAHHHAEGFIFNANHARLWCIPHTVHLAALKLLEGIGAISKSESTQAAGRGGNYQTTVSAEEDDNSAVFMETMDDENEDSADISGSVTRLRKIIRSVRSSPQRRKAWLEDVGLALRHDPSITGSTLPLMLILDVKTRWSSTHQMLRRALQYKDILNDFIGKQRNRDLLIYELTTTHWNAIELVEKWLRNFHTATVQILVNSHLKLSEYYTKIDESPYYTWASHPRISYEALKDDYKDDYTLLTHLEACKASLEAHFEVHYKRNVAPIPLSASSSTQSINSDSSQVDLLSRYRRKERAVMNELDGFWRLPQEDMDSCDPIKWWYSRRLQFPNLYRLARDVLGIPGSAVAVERIFSAARDTLSLCRASLKPDTIQILMLYKQHIRRSRNVTT